MQLIKAVARLVKIKFSEPLELIWNFLMPTVFLVIVNYKLIGQDIDEKVFIDRIELFLAWTIAISAIYGVGMLTVYWRENGMLETFVQGKTARKRLIRLFISYQFISSMISSYCMIIVSMILFKVEPSLNLFILGIVSSIGGILVGTASLIITCFNWSLQNLSTALSILIVVFAWVAPQIPEESIFHYVNVINPIYFVVSFIKYILNNEIRINEFFLSMSLLGFSAYFGYLKILKGRIWNR